jgi:hypothetical protein
MNYRIQVRKCIALWISLLSIVTVFFSCEIDDEIPLCPPVSDKVLLVYFGGDNNLSGETYQKIDAIKKGMTQDRSNCKLLIYSDPARERPVLLEIKGHEGSGILDTVAVYDEENSASASVFARIIGEVRDKYPSKSYGLLLFSHASGWLPQGALNNPSLRSIVMDGNTEMEIADFAKAIPDKAFEYIVFEACLMANIEAIYELRNKTDYILASSAEIVSPGFTEIYPFSINYLLDGDLTAFASNAFNYFNQQIYEMHSATFSIIKTAELQALANFVAEKCQFDKQVNINVIQHFDRSISYHLFFDFEDYYSSLLDSDSQRGELQQLINNCVIWKKATPSFLINSSGFYINHHSGITAYIPQENFPLLNMRYEEMEWSKNR